SGDSSRDRNFRPASAMVSTGALYATPGGTLLCFARDELAQDLHVPAEDGAAQVRESPRELGLAHQGSVVVNGDPSPLIVEGFQDLPRLALEIARGAGV